MAQLELPYIILCALSTFAIFLLLTLHGKMTLITRAYDQQSRRVEIYKIIIISNFLKDCQLFFYKGNELKLGWLNSNFTLSFLLMPKLVEEFIWIVRKYGFVVHFMHSILQLDVVKDFFFLSFDTTLSFELRPSWHPFLIYLPCVSKMSMLFNYAFLCFHK